MHRLAGHVSGLVGRQIDRCRRDVVEGRGLRQAGIVDERADRPLGVGEKRDGSTLLDQVKQVAGKHNVLVENPAIGTSDATPEHQAVFASFEIKSPWPPLLHFLYDIQQPESFVVFESITLNIDSADPTQMRGKMKLARWFAPAGPK